MCIHQLLIKAETKQCHSIKLWKQEEEICHQIKNKKLLIIGDLNSRVGNEVLPDIKHHFNDRFRKNVFYKYYSTYVLL